MNKFFSMLMLSFFIINLPLAGVAADNERTVKPVQFAKGASATEIKGSIKGSHYIDYQLRAGAGQTMTVSLQSKHRANYFNVLPPGSQDVAMFIEGAGDRVFNGLLPDDGTYTIRVYLMRSAARRNEAADFTLSVGVSGKLLPALPAKADALVPGTRFHASATIKCVPAYSQPRQCEASVVRRGNDGTATVEVRWDKTWVRRILFVQGKALAADVPQAMTFSKGARDDLLVTFEGDERFEIPAALVFGG